MAMTDKVSTCLWFDRNAEEAVAFYTSVFPNSKILAVTRYGEAGPGPKGSVLTIVFKLDGREFTALNGGPVFSFTPAISLVVTCADQDEVDEMWSKLIDGGAPQQCGWLTDRFGLSWQIVPAVLQDMVQDEDAESSNRVMAALLKMVKLDIAELEKAYRQ
jgi:predicted 3-demethylubiquinone-9 3-methyltransferase (glyoxalase superfamily)